MTKQIKKGDTVRDRYGVSYRVLDIDENVIRAAKGCQIAYLHISHVTIVR